MDSSDSHSEVDSKGKGRQLRWTQGMDECMIETFVEHARLGHKGDKGFQDEAYNAVIKALADRVGVDVCRKHIDHRLKTLRTEYRMFNTLKEQAGFEWDPAKNMVTAPNSVWNDYIKAHPKFKFYRGRACKWDYESLGIIIGNEQSTGSFAIVALDSSDSQPEVDNKGKGRQLRWTQAMDECMIETFVEQARLGLKGDKGFKDKAYNAVTKALADQLDVDVCRNHIDNRLKTLRTEYRMFYTLREHSGFRWDPIKNMVTAQDSVWNDYIKAHPKFKFFRGRACKWDYDSLGIILGNDHATGSFAMGSLDFSDTAPEVDNKGKVRQLRWTQGMDECMIETFVEQVRLGHKGDKGFKDQAYNAVSKALSDRFNVDVCRKHIDNRLKTIRTEYHMFNTLREQNEFDWDPAKNMVTASDSVWNDYIKAHPKFKPYRGKACKWDLKLLGIIIGKDDTTESFAMSVRDVDVDMTLGPSDGLVAVDELPPIDEDMNLDDTDEEEDQSSQDGRRKPSPTQQMRHGKKPRTVDVVREMMDVMEAKIRGLAKSVDGLSFAKELYSEIMKVEGFSPDFLDRAFEILKRDGHGAEIFLVRNDMYRKRMLEELQKKHGDSNGNGRTD